MRSSIFLFTCLFLTNSFGGTTDSLLTALKKAPNDTNKIWLFNSLGLDYLKTNPIKAGEYFQEGAALSESLNFISGKIDLNKNIGTSFYYMGQLDSTKRYWKRSLNYIPNDNFIKKADGLNNMGVLFLRIGFIDSSLYYHSESLRLKMIAKDTIKAAASISNMAALYRQIGDFEKSLDLYFKSLSIYKTHNLLTQEADVLNGIGLIYYGIQEFDPALDYLEQSLKIRESQGNLRTIGSSYNNLAAVLRDMDEDEKASQYLKNYLAISIELDDFRGIAGAYSNLGGVFKNKNEIDSSDFYYLKSLHLFESLNDNKNIGVVANNLGFIQLKKNNPRAALVYFERALEFATNNNSLDFQKHIYKGIADAYTQTKNYEQALKFQQKLYTIKDSIFHIDLAKEVAFYQEQYEAEENAKQIAELRINAIKNQQEIAVTKLYSTVAWIFAGLGIALFILILFLYRLRKKVHKQRELILLKEKSEVEQLNELKLQEIAMKNRELTSLSTNAVQKNELLNTLNDKLKKLEKENGTTIFELDLLIKNGLNMDADWETYQRHFSSVHPTFFNQLNARHPSLSANDLRVCAYMKMNLSTKEIATLMNITPKSVRMNRYRLKKKMTLSEELEVYTYLNSLARTSLEI